MPIVLNGTQVTSLGQIGGVDIQFVVVDGTQIWSNKTYIFNNGIFNCTKNMIQGTISISSNDFTMTTEVNPDTGKGSIVAIFSNLPQKKSKLHIVIKELNNLTSGCNARLLLDDSDVVFFINMQVGDNIYEVSSYNFNKIRFDMASGRNITGDVKISSIFYSN